MLDDTFYFTSSYDENCLQSLVSGFVVVHGGKKQEKMAERQHKWVRSRMKTYYKYIFFTSISFVAFMLPCVVIGVMSLFFILVQ